VLSLEPDGLLSWVASAASDYLAWADEQRRPHSINPLALVESTLEFMRIYIGLVLSRCSPAVAEWSVAGGMSDVRENGQPSLLTPGPLRDFFASDWQPAPANEISLGPYTFRDEPASMAAFRVLSDVYRNFGIDAGEIPYTDGQQVREDLIRQIRL
jgi:hypothetical protein